VSLSEFIRAVRKQRGLSQRQLSLLSGISNSEISRIEAGERKNPSPDVLKALSKPLGVAYEELMKVAGYLNTNNLKETQNARPLPSWVYKLPPDMQKFVEEESKHGWPYLRLARGLKMKDLSPAELEAIVETWMDAKRRYEREFGKKPET